MSHIVEGSLIIVVGLAIIIFRKRLLQDTADFQKEVFKFHYGKREIKSAKFSIIVVGIFGIVFGALVLLGIVHTK